MKDLRVSAWLLSIHSYHQPLFMLPTPVCTPCCLKRWSSHFQTYCNITEFRNWWDRWGHWHVSLLRKGSSLVSCTPCPCGTWSASQELLWDAANTDLSTCRASCTAKLILNSTRQQLADVFLKLTYISTLRLDQDQNENKIQKGNLNWKTAYRNSPSNYEVPFHWAVHNCILKPKMSIHSGPIKINSSCLLHG